MALLAADAVATCTSSMGEDADFATGLEDAADFCASTAAVFGAWKEEHAPLSAQSPAEPKHIGRRGDHPAY